MYSSFFVVLWWNSVTTITMLTFSSLTSKLKKDDSQTFWDRSKHYYRHSQYKKTMQQKHQQGHWTLHAMEEINNRCHSILLSWWWIILFNFGLAFFHAYSVLIFQPVLWYRFLLFFYFSWKNMMLPFSGVNSDVHTGHPFHFRLQGDRLERWYDFSL